MWAPVPCGLLLWQPKLIFFTPRQQCETRFSAPIIPFIFCESITETKQDTVVHRHAQIIPTPPPLTHTHKKEKKTGKQQHPASTLHTVYVRCTVTQKRMGHKDYFVKCVSSGTSKEWGKIHPRDFLLQTNWTQIDIISWCCCHIRSHSH